LFKKSNVKTVKIVPANPGLPWTKKCLYSSLRKNYSKSNIKLLSRNTLSYFHVIIRIFEQTKQFTNIFTACFLRYCFTIMI